MKYTGNYIILLVHYNIFIIIAEIYKQISSISHINNYFINIIQNIISIFWYR
jgi:hypothetical protein